METLFPVLATNLAVALGTMVFAWVISILKKDAGVTDIFWGLGFVFIAWVSFLVGEGYFWRGLFLTMFTTIWGLRLTIHILIRNWGQPEDRRYQAFRKRYGDQFWYKSLYTVFGLQAILMWIISFVIQDGITSSLPLRLTWLDASGALIWVIGFVLEALADWQLSSFKRDPGNQGKVMDKGLWAFSRHPNYFGESLIWWGIFIITLSTPRSLWTIISPILITFLLLRVSGVRMLERTINKRRPEYEAYSRNTSAFIPWFNKKTKP
jgi:steroid 5-alpha reductase family enzyme